VPQLQQVAESLAGTLANLHIAFDMHGDIKPDNVLLTKQGLLQVADPLGNGTLFTILFAENRGGTPGYMAPEIMAGGTISRASDVYSYGATIYHLLTGKIPQNGQRFDLPSEGNGYEPRMFELVTACCDPNPSARPTMQEVLQMLRGKPWASIRESRKQREEFVKAACVFGGACFSWCWISEEFAGKCLNPAASSRLDTSANCNQLLTAPIAARAKFTA
jgi:serine/threonine protein kinase